MPSRTERVFLRPLELADVATYALWGRDRRFCEHAGWTMDLPAAEHETHWRTLIEHPKSDLLRRAAVLGDDVIGYVDLAGADPDRRELGYVVGPSDRWGRGLGGIVARLGLDWGFRELGLEEIWAEAVNANRASVRILASLGMTEVGRGADEEFLGVASHYRRFSIRPGS
ncbi:RimJ/RimL family protein N-acetyltransferase [Kribbella pratensis]|uniref:RimJ/RimL family protein N-acetyltransferase n=1 Tax=Kribbella pratensis TaxID=2512112 RepID=A0ABY2FR61_9ACTN|nr:GNAT family N-acetyltransferase [Kribbella pratensis]TDW95610.1 RimJ/RimL family protein N-acetyltransferase [Kribbella pratensis]